MCLAIPGEIKSIDTVWANVDIMGVEDRVNIQLIDNVRVGDLILIHAGCGIQRIHPEQYNFLNRMIGEMMRGDCLDG